METPAIALTRGHQTTPPSPFPSQHPPSHPDQSPTPPPLVHTRPIALTSRVVGEGAHEGCIVIDKQGHVARQGETRREVDTRGYIELATTVGLDRGHSRLERF